MTWRERWLVGTVRATISGSPTPGSQPGGVIERRPCRLGSVAVPPEGSSEPPGDVDGRLEMRLKGNDAETDNPGKAGFAGNFDDPLAEAVFLPMGAGTGHPSLVSRRQIFHHRRIGRHQDECGHVFVTPPW